MLLVPGKTGRITESVENVAHWDFQAGDVSARWIRSLNLTSNPHCTRHEDIDRKMEKRYLAVVEGRPKEKEWICRLKLAPDPDERGRMTVDARHGKEAETRFRVLATREKISLIEARPVTGRTHQIRVHLAECGFPVLGDELYGASAKKKMQLGLRAVELSYVDPFLWRRIEIQAPVEKFVREYGFEIPKEG